MALLTLLLLYFRWEVSREIGVGPWIGFIWLRAEISGRSCEHSNKPSGLYSAKDFLSSCPALKDSDLWSWNHCFMDFVHRPIFQITRKTDIFPSSGEGKETSTLLGPLERTNLNHLTIPTPQDGNKYSLRDVFSSYLEFPKMGKVQKPNDSECYAPSSEPFRFYFHGVSHSFRTDFLLDSIRNDRALLKEWL
jgi:hypothetical protein